MQTGSAVSAACPCVCCCTSNIHQFSVHFNYPIKILGNKFLWMHGIVVVPLQTKFYFTLFRRGMQ